MVQTGQLSPLVSTTPNQNQVSMGNGCPSSHHYMASRLGSLLPQPVAHFF